MVSTMLLWEITKTVIGTAIIRTIAAEPAPWLTEITVLIALFVLVGNIVIDLIYGLLDPRIVRT